MSQFETWLEVEVSQNDTDIFLTGDITVAIAPATQVSFKIAHHLLNRSNDMELDFKTSAL